MNKTILSKFQQFFLDEFRKDDYLPKVFYLTGGTALAEFYLKHRYSEDLDFFTQNKFDEEKTDLFINQTGKKMDAKNIERQHIYDRFQYILNFNDEILKAEFVKYEFPNIKPLKEFDGLLVVDIYDIAVNKLFTILDRTEIKDYVDLYYLLKKFTVKKLLGGIENKYGFKIDPINMGAELLKVRKLDLTPRMIKKLTKEELIKFFENEAYNLKKDIFPI